jgi:electron transport complex protein RnfA
VSESLLILIGAGLISNLILDHMLGVDPLVAVSRRSGPAIDIALLLLFVMPITTAGGWLLNSLLLVPYGLVHLQLMGLVLSTTVLVTLIVALLQYQRPALHARLQLYVPILLFNGTLLGVVLLDLDSNQDFTGSLLFGLGAAAGAGLVLLLVSAIRERIEGADVPVPFRGIPILLITLGLMSMAFLGFKGMGNP